MSIFVQMTSYRGFDVIPTVRDCIEKAKDRDGLYFGIALQQDEGVPNELSHERIKVERVDLKDSLGHGWARSRAQSFYDGQDYTLQIDSGCRFADGWDEGLVEALKLTGSSKPIITNPANKFNPEKNEREYADTAYKSQAYQMMNETPLFWPVALKNVKAIQKARVVADHFLFTLGSHCTECKYDPGLYYSEVESAVALRSYTMGFDLFHHFKPFVFRNYGQRQMNWNDDQSWWHKDQASKKRFVALLEGKVEPEYSLGTSRSIKDFEHYSGIDFVGRRLHKDAIAGTEPPCNYQNEDAWQAEFMKDYSIVATWDPAKVADSDDYDYWMFAVEDATGTTINRQDFRWERDKAILEKKASSKRVFFKAMGNRKPLKIAIQPFSKSKGALEKVTFDL